VPGGNGGDLWGVGAGAMTNVLLVLLVIAILFPRFTRALFGLFFLAIMLGIGALSR
jgi:hypothetical protein